MAKNTWVPRPRVVVMGEPGVAERIASDLAVEGLNSETERTLGLRLPEPPALEVAVQLRETVLDLMGRVPRGSLWMHPGVSAWADRPELPQICQELGVPVFAPAARVLSLFGNKLNLLQAAERLGIPTPALGFEPLHTAGEVKKFLNRFPDMTLVFKSVQGHRDGVGLFVLQNPKEPGAISEWIEQLEFAQGESVFFAEKFIEGARLLTLPFARLIGGRGDTHVEFFPPVEGSLHHHGRRLVEFCPYPDIENELFHSICAWTERLLEDCQYWGVGVVDFLVDAHRAYLVDGLARLNTTFHLWEKTAGTRAVQWQLAALEPQKVAIPKCTPDVHWKMAACARIIAEDPVFELPQPGRVHQIDVENSSTSFVDGTLAEVDWNVSAGGEVEIDSSGLIGSVFVGSSRQGFGGDASGIVSVLSRQISQLWISGSIKTNEAFLQELLTHPWVKLGMFHASFLLEDFVPRWSLPGEWLAIAASLCKGSVPQDSGDGTWWVENRMVDLQKTVLPRWKTEPERVEVGLSVPGIFWAVEGKLVMGHTHGEEQLLRVGVYPMGDHRWRVRMGRHFFLVQKKVTLSRIGVDSGTRRIKLNAQTSGQMNALLVREGTLVQPHQVVAQVGSLGRLVSHSLPIGTRVLQWWVRPGDVVVVGQDLGVFSKDETGGIGSA